MDIFNSFSSSKHVYSFPMFPYDVVDHSWFGPLVKIKKPRASNGSTMNTTLENVHLLIMVILFGQGDLIKSKLSVYYVIYIVC